MQTSQLLDQINHDIHNHKINPTIDSRTTLILSEANHRMYEPIAPQRIIIRAYLHDSLSIISTPDEQLEYKSMLIWDNTTQTTDTYLLNKVHQTLHYDPIMIPYLTQYSAYNVDHIYEDSHMTLQQKLQKIIKDVFECHSKLEFIKILFHITDDQLIRFKIDNTGAYNGIAILYKS